MVKLKLVSDFDGVWTDPVPEADMMGRVMVEEFVRCGALSGRSVKKTLESVQRHLMANHSEYGWVSNGRISAYVDEDPLVIHTTTSIYLEKSVGNGETGLLGEVIRSEGGVAPFTTRCYLKAVERFRNEFGCCTLENGAGEFIDELTTSGFETVVVSNSPSSKLTDWLEGYLDRIKIRGDAGKFNLGEKEGGLPADDENPSIFVDRPAYREILLTERPDIVIGDGLSQDLALPYYLRRKKILENLVLLFVRHPHTPSWALERFRRWSGPADAIVDGFEGVRRAIHNLVGKAR